jgi:hypothetical protein
MSTPSNRRHTTDGQGVTPRSVLFSGVQGTVDSPGVFHNIIDETSADLYTEEDEKLLDDEEDQEFDNGISFADSNENRTAKGPDVGSWKEVTYEEAPVRATIGEPTEIVWSDAKAEIGFIREAVFQKKFKTNHPSFVEVSNLLFGPSSKLRLVFMYKLGWSGHDFEKFMKTFFVQSAHRLSASALFSPQGYIVKGETKELLFDIKTYTRMWKSIGEACLISDQRASSHVAGETFWAAVEHALNEELRSTILPSFLASDLVPTFRVIFDDDKMHFALGKDQSAASLQMCQHIRDNRRGPVCHQGVLSASGILVGCSFERPKDTTKSCTRKIIHSQMTPMQGGGGTGAGTLRKLSVGGDRDYQNRELLYETFVPSGAKLLGTKKRSKDFPLVYGPKLDPAKEKREVIPMNGPKTIIVKKVRRKMKSRSIFLL